MTIKTDDDLTEHNYEVWVDTYRRIRNGQLQEVSGHFRRWPRSRRGKPAHPQKLTGFLAPWRSQPKAGDRTRTTSDMQPS